MAASLKQDYAKILQAGAELVMISPDSRDEHRSYGLRLFGAELPYLFVPTATWKLRAATAWFVKKNIIMAGSTIARSGYSIGIA